MKEQKLVERVFKSVFASFHQYENKNKNPCLETSVNNSSLLGKF